MKSRSSRHHYQEIKGKFDQGEANPFASFVDSLCDVVPVNAETLERRKKAPVRIALVSMPALSKGDFKLRRFNLPRVPRGVDPEDCKRQLVALRGNLHKQWLDAYKEALTFAVDEFHADIICVSELGLPHRNALPMKEAQRFARDLSATRNVLIVAGTSHDHRTRYNTGYVYYPGGPEEAFHKTLSATGMEEYISSPAKRRVLRIEAFGLAIATMICLDIADYVTLASVVRVRDKVNMLLVPCYTKKWDKMLDMAKLASNALRGVVAMVNAHVPNAICHIARFGEDEEPVRKKDFHSGTVVSMFEVRHEALDKERNRKRSPQEHQQVDWLFGIRDPHRPSRRETARRGAHR